MKITLCGSIAFYDEMLEAKKALEKAGHEVKLPPNMVKNEAGEMFSVKEYYSKRKTATDNETWVWDRKAEAIMNHFQKVSWADAILVCNYDKRDIKDYIGGNTLMEMGIAFYLKKKIFLLNRIPELSYKEEILGMKPVVVNRDLSLIKS